MTFKLNIDKRALTKKVEGNIRTALIISGQGLVTYIRESMVPGTHKKYDIDGSIHMSSSPGSPPSPRSGKLRDSITYQTNFGDKCATGPMASPADAVGKPKRAMGGYVVSVGSNVSYALSMEKGEKTHRVAPRPYLRTALMANRALIKRAFTRV